MTRTSVNGSKVPHKLRPTGDLVPDGTMKLAFLISAHKLERQFEWLFRALWNPEDVFLIHVNASAPEPYFRALQSITAGCCNVHYLPRMRISWGGWSIVEMGLEALRFLCARPENWRYFINLSGQDYPVRPVEHLRGFLHEHVGANFLEIRHINTLPFHIRRRLHWYCVEHRGGIRRFPLPNVRAILTPVEWHGDFWGLLSREFCEWLMASELTHVYRDALRHTKIPDEFFFQTLLMRSPFASTLIPDARRYLRYEYYKSPGPKTLTSADLGPLLESSAFFARKFDEAINSIVLHQLADRIGARTPAAA